MAQVSTVLRRLFTIQIDGMYTIVLIHERYVLVETRSKSVIPSPHSITLKYW
jgi:hypothetical protein